MNEGKETGGQEICMARSSTLVRLALALLIGALAGSWFDLTHPTAIDVALNALVIAVPPLLAVALMKTELMKTELMKTELMKTELMKTELMKTEQRGGALLRVGLAVALLVVILPLGDVLLNAIQRFPRFDTTFVIGMAVVLCPLIAAFAVGTRGARLGGTVGLALGCGVLAWVGMGLHNLFVPLLLGQFSSSGPSSDFGDLVFAVLLVFYALGFVLALLLGLLGALLRLWLAHPSE
jgi:hypothetical protein